MKSCLMVEQRIIMKNISALLLIVIISISGFAFQNTGSISGYVKDSKTGEPLIGVAVRLLDTQKGAVTDINGYYQINDVEAKTYSIEASYVGFKTQTKYNLVVRSGGIPDVNFDLEETVSELNEVVIVANPFEKEEETPLSIQNLSSEEIATYPGGNNDVAKVVQSLPGVSGSVGGFRNDIIIRGGAPNENVYYLDGIEIPNINHFSTQGSAGGPVGLLNVSFFEGVTLATSSFGAQYDNVLSGVLQFQQRDGNNRNYQTNIRVSSSETALTTEGPLFRRGKETANTSFIASVRRSYLQLLFKAIGLPFLPDYWDYQYKVTHKINDYNKIIITGVGAIDDFSINVPDDYSEEQQLILDQLGIIKQWSTTGGISWQNRFKDGSGFMNTSLSTNVLNNDYQQFQDNENQTGLLFQNISQEQETKLRYTIQKFRNNWIMKAGGVIQNADYSNNTEDLVNNFSYNQNLNFWRYGLFVQGVYNSKNDRLSTTLGIRTDGNNFMSTGSNLLETFSPRVAASYKLDSKQKWTINASLGRYYKIPPYTILGFTDATGSFANKNVKYIQSDHAVAGIEYLITKGGRITIEAFYKQYDNYPVSRVDSVSLANLGGDFNILGNEPVASVGKGKTRGVEFLFQQKLTKNVYAILAYTLYRSEFTGFDPDEYLRSSWDNQHLLTFTGGYKFGRNWELSARMRYLGNTPYAPVDQQATLATYPVIIKDYSQQGSVELPAFNQTDIRIDKKWNFKNWTLDVFLEVLNVFNQTNPSEPAFGLVRDDVGNVIQPRQLKEVESVGNSSPLPSIGIVIDF